MGGARAAPVYSAIWACNVRSSKWPEDGYPSVSCVMRGAHCQVLLLNGSHDRETRGMSAADFVSSICHALNRTHGEDSRHRLRHDVGSLRKDWNPFQPSSVPCWHWPRPGVGYAFCNNPQFL